MAHGAMAQCPPPLNTPLQVTQKRNQRFVPWREQVRGPTIQKNLGKDQTKDFHQDFFFCRVKVKTPKRVCVGH